MTTLKMAPMFEAVSSPFVQQFMQDGQFNPNDVTEQAVTAMLNELLRSVSAPKPLRTPAGSVT